MATDLLPFQRTIIEQILEDDCLCILAPGLGLHQLISVLLRLQDVRLQDPQQQGAVLIIGASAWQKTALKQELLRIHPEADRLRRPGVSEDDPFPSLPAEVTADIATAERLRLYKSCSCLFVTTRILVVDLLSGRVAPSDVAGIYVLNSHRVTDSSGEGFVVRLYREGNTSGFVRGFSDYPSSFTSEFGKVEKVMKALRAPRLHLWPRFQVAVQEDLEARPPELVEVSLPCDSGAALLYEALSDLVDGCVKELRKSERLDTTDLTPTLGLSSSFDETIRRQLAPIWHTVSPKTRQIVADLRTLRTLAGLLNKLDPVTFLNYLDTLRATEGTRCTWLFHSSAHTVFEAAKARVYRLGGGGTAATGVTGSSGRGRGKKRKSAEQGNAAAPGTSSSLPGETGNTTTSVPVLDPILDELPKWNALLEILEEARQERHTINASTPGEDDDAATANEVPPPSNLPSSKTPTSPPPPPPILVFCQDEYTCVQLREVAGPHGPSGLMRRMYRDYLQYKIDIGSSTNRKKGGNGEEDTTTSTTTAMPPRMMGGYLPGEEAALVKEAKGLGARSSSTSAAAVRAMKGGGGGRGGGGGGGRGRGRGGRGRHKIDHTIITSTNNPNLNKKDEETTCTDGGGGGGDENTQQQQQPLFSPLLADPEDVCFIPLDSAGALPLWHHSPTHVVVYDPDVALTRSLELFKAQRRSLPLRVYLLRYEDSPEMDKYQGQVVRERAAFENLIRAKGIMAPAVATTTTISTTTTAAINTDIIPGLQHPLALSPVSAAGNAITRRAGGRLAGRPERVCVIVDVREFMSPLPAVLHGKGLQIVPLTLEVGDYVLSPEICVERKSLSDLRGSLISGRLYQQAEAMCRHYRIAILLIEFDGDRAFALQGVGELGDDIHAHAMMSRLVLLCLHHPRLRLVWSRSLHATADIFKQLKTNHEEPDPVTAATVGNSGEEGGAAGGGGQGGETLINNSAIDVLRRLPGVTDANYRGLMREADSLAGLSKMSLGELTVVMGGEVAAKKLKEFLSQECRALFQAL